MEKYTLTIESDVHPVEKLRNGSLLSVVCQVNTIVHMIEQGYDIEDIKIEVQNIKNSSKKLSEELGGMFEKFKKIR